MQGFGSNSEVRQRRKRDPSLLVEAITPGRNEQNKTYFETLEYIGFIIAGSATWIFIAWKVLAWHKFPFHLYLVEVGFIFIVPIILLVGVLSLTDRITRLLER